MIIETHIIQNVAPANLNRDDTGAPKDAVFGGYRRARVSSQAWKRAVRQAFKVDFAPDELSVRTRRLGHQIATLLEADNYDPEQAEQLSKSVLELAGATVAQDGRSQTLWFVPSAAAGVLAELAKAHSEALAGAGKVPDATAKSVKAAVQSQVINARAVDLALFGRMLTDAPDGGTVDAAVQVAHALSTHTVDVEFDYFTAVDDLLPSDEVGAGMIGTIEFNSACLYRYAALNVTQLAENLDGDLDLTARATASFLTNFVTAMPTGKQNTFAAHNPPSAVVFVSRDAGTWNLANAFVDPVRAAPGRDLVTQSCERLARHWQDLVAMYGDPATHVAGTATGDVAASLSPFTTTTLADAISSTVERMRA